MENPLRAATGVAASSVSPLLSAARRLLCSNDGAIRVNRVVAAGILVATVGFAFSDHGHLLTGPWRFDAPDMGDWMGLFALRAAAVFLVLLALSCELMEDEEDMVAMPVIAALVSILVSFTSACIQSRFVELPPDPPATYSVQVACPHCGASTDIESEEGRSWTERESFTCEGCGVCVRTSALPEREKALHAIAEGNPPRDGVEENSEEDHDGNQ